jgi:putative copper resistance protein D
VTLALRTVGPRVRRGLRALLHSRVARVMSFPPLAFLLFVGSPYVLYFSGLYPASLENPLLHEALHLHFVAVGCLFFWPLIGLDPLPGRAPYPFRALLMFLSMPIHAVLGLTIMDSSTLLAASHYRGLGLAWVDPAQQQQIGGGLLWASGDLVSLLMLGALIVQWIAASEREAAREDRRLDRLERLDEARKRADETNGEETPVGPAHEGGEVPSAYA